MFEHLLQFDELVQFHLAKYLVQLAGQGYILAKLMIASVFKLPLSIKKAF